MASVPPPQGMNEIDYEAIEAAVTETVRGRWFLSEYARRNRLAETRQLLDAMARIEAVVTANQTALPSADPSIRLLIQRIKEIAGQLGAITSDMRAADVDQRLVDAVDAQARAVSGMMRSATMGARPEPTRVESPRQALAGGTASADHPPKSEMPKTEAPRPAAPATQAMPRMPRAEPFSPPTRPSQDRPSNSPTINSRPNGHDPRLAALAEIDALPLARKLASFI